MEIFNIGPLELIIVLVIMFLLLGPDEMKRTARRIAVGIRKFVRSPMWADITGMSQEIRELPKRLMEDTGLEEAIEDVKATTTAAANEVNTAVKESVEAARVREVEHLRLNTQKLSPDAGKVIMPPRTEKAEGEEPADNGQPSPESAIADANAHALEVDIEAVPREPAQDQPLEEVVNTIQPPAEVVTEVVTPVVKKPRRKKADTVIEVSDTLQPPAEVDTEVDTEVVTEVVKKPRRKKVETETVPADAEGANAAPGIGETPAPKPRRAPRRKAAPTAEDAPAATDAPATSAVPEPTLPGSNGSGPEEHPIAKDDQTDTNAP